MKKKKKIGFTTSVPVEVIYSGNAVPIDLNNIFINDIHKALEYVSKSELIGFPRASCGWIKGLYSVAMESNFDSIITVIEGDCSQSHALSELWIENGVNVIPFSYPYGRNREKLHEQIEFLIKKLNTNWDDAEAWKDKLDKIRKKIHLLDKLTYERGNISGFENHIYQVCSSDFNSDPIKYETEIEKRIERSLSSASRNDFIRLGYIGVPPIISGLYDTLENFGGKVIYNEVQRQFTMPYATDNLLDQYLKFTYPYDIFARIEDINEQIEIRKLDGIIHYTQSFCFRQIQDILLSKYIKVPVLTIEGDSPQYPDERTKIRLESFLEMLNPNLY